MKSETSGRCSTGTDFHCEMAPGVTLQSFARSRRRPRSAFKYDVSFSMDTNLSPTEVSVKLIFSV